MDALSAWLIGTAPGVVVLGAFGSLLAVFVLEKAKVLARTWVPRIERWTGRALFWWLDESLEACVRLKLTNDNYPTLALFAYELGKLVVLAAGAQFFLIWAVLAFVTHRAPDLPVNAVVMFGFFFLCVYGALKLIVRLWFHRTFTMRGGLYDSTIKQHVEGKSDVGPPAR